MSLIEVVLNGDHGHRTLLKGEISNFVQSLPSTCLKPTATIIREDLREVD
jgi:hypothetical protein